MLRRQSYGDGENDEQEWEKANIAWIGAHTVFVESSIRGTKVVFGDWISCPIPAPKVKLSTACIILQDLLYTHIVLK